MLSAALLLASCARQSPSVGDIDKLARARNVEGLRKLVVGNAPLDVLRTNGAYEAGRFGWTAEPLTLSNGRRFIVLTTPLTGEDVGDLLFSVGADGKLSYVPETETFGVRIARQTLTADFDLPKKTAKLTSTVEISADTRVGTPGIGGPLPPLTGFFVRLGPNFRVSALTGPNAIAVPYVQGGGVIYVDAPKASGTFTMTYSGVVNRPQYAGSIDAEHIQLTNEFWHPSIGRLPSPYTLSAKVPTGWTAVGQGERTMSGDRIVFDMRLPTSVWSFSAEPFKIFSREDKNRRGYDVYSRNLTEEEMRLQTEVTEPILDYYARTFAPYPFARWGAADVKTYGGGALEAYNFATYGRGFLPTEDAHEPAHTWWGGILPNTYLRSFWNESFAVWSEGLYNRNVPIGNAAARRAAFADLALADGSYDRVPVASGSCFIGPEASALGYGKGAHVLAMLEDLLGTDRMIEACREWIKGHRPGEAAEWEGFETTVLRLNPKLELKGFFDHWLRTPITPEVRASTVAWAGTKLEGKLAAKPPRMPLEFVLVSATGQVSRRMLDTGEVGADGSFLLTGVDRPARVLVDPYHRALRLGPSAPSTGFFSAVRGFKVYRDPATKSEIELRGAKLDAVPDDLDRTVLVGHPRTMPQMTPLLAKLGMEIAGDTLSWRGTSVDLKQSGAVAVVDLGGGKRCGLVLGTSKLTPNLGRASIALFDRYGRLLNGLTPLPEPKDGVFEIR